MDKDRKNHDVSAYLYEGFKAVHDTEIEHFKAKMKSLALGGFILWAGGFFGAVYFPEKKAAKQGRKKENEKRGKK